MLPFALEQAEVAARLYRSARRARAKCGPRHPAHAIRRDAAPWTYDPDDFADIAGFVLVD